MKKVISVLLCLVLVFSLTLPAFASDTLTGTEVAAGEYETPYDNSRFFEVGDYIIHFRVFEAENEKGKIMMIHGFALSGYCWDELAARFVAQGYTCVIPDLPDFGYSTRETKDTDRLPREDIIHALMTYLYDGRWIVAGHSMGGYISLALMQKYPESVSALMLYSTSGNDGMADGVKKIFTNPAVASAMGAFMDLCAGCDLLFNLLLKFALNDNDYYASYDKAMVKNPARIKGTGRGAVYSFASLTATDYDYLKTCGKPVFFINGGDDNVISAEAKTKLRSYLPENSTDITLAGGGHMFIESMADEVAACALTFLGENI